MPVLGRAGVPVDECTMELWLLRWCRTGWESVESIPKGGGISSLRGESKAD
jgi:hypothetical protein